MDFIARPQAERMLITEFKPAKIKQRAAASTVEALMCGLRRGAGELERSEVRFRLFQLDKPQLREVIGRLQKFKPEIDRAGTAEEVRRLDRRDSCRVGR